VKTIECDKLSGWEGDPVPANCKSMTLFSSHHLNLAPRELLEVAGDNEWEVHDKAGTGSPS